MRDEEIQVVPIAMKGHFTGQTRWSLRFPFLLEENKIVVDRLKEKLLTGVNRSDRLDDYISELESAKKKLIANQTLSLEQVITSLYDIRDGREIEIEQ